MDEDQKLPFDLFGERTIFFRHSNLRSVEKAKSDLRAFVRETERGGFKSTSPVSRSMELGDLSEKTTSMSDALASILTEIIAVKKAVEDAESQTGWVESSVSDLESTLDDVKKKLERLVPT